MWLTQLITLVDLKNEAYEFDKNFNVFYFVFGLV